MRGSPSAVAINVDIQDEVITLADGKTANNLRGAALAGIGISEDKSVANVYEFEPITGRLFSDDAALDYCSQLNESCAWRECCEGKFICLKSNEEHSFYLILNIVKKTFLLFFRIEMLSDCVEAILPFGLGKIGKIYKLLGSGCLGTTRE